MPVPTTNFSVCIVGAGFSGINMAIKLKEIGVKFRIVEKSENLGGTWWDNQYPGCACDVPSHLYSLSYELNPDWTKSFSEQAEIKRYMEKVARKYGVDSQIELNKKVEKTTWDEKTSKWKIELSNGEVFTANVVVQGGGALHAPVVPDFKGKDSFKGDSFHSVDWKKEYDPTGKRVAVIGTGASAVQIVPSIASKVKQLYVFQRTPCWVPEKPDRVFPDWVKFMFRIYPFTMYLLRCFIFWSNEFRFFTQFRLEGILRKRAVETITQHIMTEVFDSETAKKLIPSFEVGCKRVTPSNTYLQSFNRDNVTLVTDGIDCITEEGVKTKDGTIHEVDTIIYATGFSPAESWKAVNMYGCKTDDRDRVNLKDEWQEAPNAYKGITYPGYPNAFFLLGPGTGLGHNTVVYMIECQVAYAVDAIRKMVETNIKSVDVKKRVNDDYQTWAQEYMKNKVFNSKNCFSWYKNKDGLNFALWPSHLTHYWWITRTFDVGSYTCKY